MSKPKRMSIEFGAAAERRGERIADHYRGCSGNEYESADDLVQDAVSDLLAWFAGYSEHPARLLRRIADRYDADARVGDA